MPHLRMMICLLALMVATDIAVAGDFNEPPPRDLGQLKKVHLWATHYDIRDAGARHGKDAPFGLGTFGYRLVPFRTVAADRRVFAPGTVFFIPRLVGVKFDNSGASEVHDGYVFFGDVGGAVRGKHIDFFIGATRKNPAPDLITSTRKKGFDAYIATDQDLIARLRRQHARPAPRRRRRGPVHSRS
jgi:3D (Asp-Asp-Asp) domain-containing protein